MNGCFGVPTDILDSLANEIEACANFHKQNIVVDSIYHSAYPVEVTDSLSLVSQRLHDLAPLFETLDAILKRAYRNEHYDDLMGDLNKFRHRLSATL